MRIHPSACIHPSAVIEEGASIASGCIIGPFCWIGPDVHLAENVSCASHVVIKGQTKIGSCSKIFSFAVIGEIPQDLKFNGESTALVIGERNTIREHVTINTGTEGGLAANTMYATNEYPVDPSGFVPDVKYFKEFWNF